MSTVPLTNKHDRRIRLLNKLLVFRITGAKNVFLFLWFRDIRTQLHQSNGWRLMGEILGGIAIFWGVLSGLMTYHSGNLARIMESAERSYEQLVSDLGHESLRVRIGAVRRIPSIMLRRVPLSYDVTATEVLRLTLGAKIPTAPVFHPHVKELLRQYLGSLTTQASNWSQEEVKAVIDVLGQLGPNGWYRAEYSKQIRDRRIALTWIWQPPDKTDGQYEAPTRLFEHVRLDGLDLQGFNLEQGNFKWTSLKGTNLSFCNLQRASFQGASLSNAMLANADLRQARLERADLSGADLSSAKLIFADLKYADLSQIHAHNADLSRVNLFNARLNHSHLVGSILSDTNLQDSLLEHADMVRVNLGNANLSFSSLSRSVLTKVVAVSANFSSAILDNVDFSFADITRSSFDGASLSGANLSNVTGLDSVKCYNANIAGIKGLTERQVTALIERGAVIIPNPSKWRAYREAGRPHSRWREFANPRSQHQQVSRAHAK